jgi:DNA repair protein RadD
VLQDGSKIFKNHELRFELLKTLDSARIENVYNTDIRVEDDLKKICNFSWGDNVKSRRFLQLFDLNQDWFFDRSDLLNSIQPVTEASAIAPLHGYQDWVRRQVVNFLSVKNISRTIVHMPTGAGKTRVAIESICDFFRCSNNNNSTAVWMAHSEELCEQACAAFAENWSRLGTSHANIVRLWGGQSSNIEANKNNFVVTSFQTAYRMIGSKNNDKFELFTNIKRANNLLVIDEAHQSTAPTYIDAIELISNTQTKLLGLSATPGRASYNSDDDSNFELANFYHSNKITIVGDDGQELENPIHYLRGKGVLSNYDTEYIEGSAGIQLSESEVTEVSKLLEVPKSVLDKIGADHARTARIAAATLEVAVNRRKQTILFAPTKNSAIELALYLRFFDCPAAAVTGDTPSHERARYIEDFRDKKIRVLTNFGVLTAGFDAPKTDAVVIARPTLSVVLFSQMVGRGLRGPKMGGTEHCLIIDVKDNFINMPSIDDAFSIFNEYFEG